MASVHEVMKENFLVYASYVVRDRSIPHIDDGLKPVQRRILHTLFEMDDGRFHKVSNVVGHCMRYHPHGEQSIYAALVSLAQKDVFIETQGNFGNIFTGDSASASRYIECRIHPRARRLLFHPAITEYGDSYDGRHKEPLVFPSHLPFSLILGVEGIAVGMSTSILPHNYHEVIHVIRKALKGEDYTLYPDFLTGGLIDVSEYNDGKGRVRGRVCMDVQGDKKIFIRELPPGRSTEVLIRSIELAVQKKKLGIAEINNYTAEKVEIELKLARGVKASEIINSLYAFTDCEVSIPSHILVIKDNKPVEMTITEIVDYQSKKLCDYLTAQLEYEKAKYQKEKRQRSLERIFIEEEVYLNIRGKKTMKEIDVSVRKGMDPFKAEYGSELSTEEIVYLLSIPIRRISLYDSSQAKARRKKIDETLRVIQNALSNIPTYADNYLEQITEESKNSFFRKSRIESFEHLTLRDVNLPLQAVFYDKERGFLGTKVISGEKICMAREVDRLLCMSREGSYYVISLSEKISVGSSLIHIMVASKENLSQTIFTIVYQNEKKQFYGKRAQILRYITGRKYRFIPEGCQYEYLSSALKGEIVLSLAKTARQKAVKETVEFDSLLIKGIASRGTQLHRRRINSIRLRKER